ncbi:glycoside hydrolase family 43 [Clostridium beijerinckii]|uniref:Glycoside hydrolase family 43 n=1 Tax=Clostridium beijerinckii TaxID=1520 RepID=A0A0B5QJ99_CLOBE|nr:glycoside hydrolase family 43 protein [Clostridium beijerinckii]AJG98276.1 glycoside hydrolase family 43 [Clostridium beijerinckii]
MIKNPVLTGFHPDPSMICVDGNFYVANSTFEYFPGVAISKSKDLANWESIKAPLDNINMLDMKGNPKSCGIWAPCLTYHDGLFYLVFTDVKCWTFSPFKDTPNYITTAPSINGPWSEPVFINSSGFDPSLFHDDDGKKYIVNMEWDYRKAGEMGRDKFTGILLTEIDPVSLRPISEPVNIFKGSERGKTEGPHFYKKDGFYYLITAEGGTEYSHAVTVARSKNITGPYELHPNTHLISSQGDFSAYLKKAGHGSLCKAPDGKWWIAFLCGRPLDESMRCPLGRETAIAEVIWKDRWPYLKEGGIVPAVEFEGYGEKIIKKVYDYKFNEGEFKHDFMSLRVPAKYDVLEDGRLRLYGKESLSSIHNQNMLIRRQSDFCFEAETCIDFPFEHFQRMAGLIYRYDEENQYYLRVAYNEEKGEKCLGILCFDKGNFSMPLGENEIPVGNGKIYLKLKVENRYGEFYYAKEDLVWNSVPYKIDVSILSDEYATPTGFTGAFIGMSCQDMRDSSAYADFYSFKYTVIN